jgi:hypothetical protein
LEGFAGCLLPRAPRSCWLLVIAPGRRCSFVLREPWLYTCGYGFEKTLDTLLGRLRILLEPPVSAWGRVCSSYSVTSAAFHTVLSTAVPR